MWSVQALLLCVSFGTIFRNSDGRFPMQCAQNITSGTGVCCPVPSGFSEPCGGEGRGVCQKLPVVSLNYYPRPDPLDLKVDDRFNWPHRHVQFGCKCQGNYYGHDCSSCRYGFTGVSCTEKETFIRRNALSYTARDKEVFVETVLRAKRVPSGWGVLVPTGSQTDDFVELTLWDLFQYIHFRTSQHILQDIDTKVCRPTTTGYDFGHNGPAFPTWHRAYLLWFERELRLLSPDPGFSLPYWDWVGADHCEVCTNDFLGAVLADGTLHPDSRLAGWRTICDAGRKCWCDPRADAGPLTRALGANKGTRIPSVVEARYTLTRSVYDLFPFSNETDTSSFRRCLEVGSDPVSQSGMHNGIHDWIGGAMGHLATAANDPIFLLHHAFVDKLFEVWLRSNHPVTSYPVSYGPPGHLAKSPLVPLFPVEYNIDYYHESSAFGYEYDTLHVPFVEVPGRVHHWTLWQLVAVCVAGVVILVAACIIICCVCKHRRAHKKHSHAPSNSTPVNTDRANEKKPLLPK